jgi:plasmid stabilization system protein ParE
MQLQIVILPSAKSDIQSAYDWYENQQTGLGRKFAEQVVKAIDILHDTLRGYGAVYMSLSRIFVKNFPYVIWFKTDSVGDKVVIYAVLNEKQNREDILKKRI